MPSPDVSRERALVGAVLERLVAVTERPVWPGFRPATMPLAIAIADTQSTWRTAPSPDVTAPTVTVPGSRTMTRFPEIDPRIVANSVTDFDGVPTATATVPAGALASGGDTGWDDVAGLVVHELFHVHQAETGFAPGANEAVLLIAPWDDPESLALARAEWMALRRAVEARDDALARAAFQEAVALRRERASRLPESVLDYVRAAERMEGTATYVETRARRDGMRVHDWMDEASLDLRRPCYDTGLAWCLLLDRFGPAEWTSTVATPGSTPLDEVAAAVCGKGSAGSAGFWRDLVPATEAAIARERSRRDERLASLRSADRNRVVVSPASGHDLVVTGFDPINVLAWDAATVVHERYLALAAGESSLTVLDIPAITTSAGDHPLFTGLREAEIVGNEDGARVWPDARLRIDGDHAVTERDDGMVAIVLGAPV